MRITNNTISHARLQELLDYNPETGEFRWRVSPRSNVKAGDVAGCRDKHGYWVIRIDKRDYKAHRLAWFYTRGVWPANDIDHINRTPSDNRINNLRETTRSQNKQNSTYSRGDSKHRGVCWNKAKNKWTARIVLNRKTHHLGYFDNEAAAAAMYKLFQQRLHSHSPRVS